MTVLRIGLLWHSAAAGNLGVGALSVGNIALAREAASRAGVTPHFTLFGGREVATPYIVGDDIEVRTIDGRYMISPGGYFADMRTMDIMLDIGAGDSFADIYPNKRFAYLMSTKALAIWAGVPLILSPQTIGPFSHRLHTSVAAWACRRAAMVFARDPLSMDVLHRMAPTAKARQVIDVAFALPFDRPVRSPVEPIKVGINVSGLLMSGGYGSSNDYGLTLDYPALTRRLITEFSAMPGVEVHLVPHVIAPAMPRDDDGAASDALKAEFPNVVRVPNFASPSAAKSYIAGLDFLTGARMHATIAAYSAGVPVVPISYSRKFEGLFGGLNYPWTVPARSMGTDAALAFILDAFARRKVVAGDIAAGNAVITAGLEDYTAELTRQFAAIGR
ncbi:MAG: polysaccharide pyruvyl transferase [Alphaproteobacteria bacterium PA4]|nr:MAG: polysaccharide pyruvyl transferase [Alphaproteobacteria bacterium PA4]